ncbi:hypothetical protein [Segatella copri]|nr:hypothetical protein [Segatella copri]WOF93933.1 hypothetical protein RJT10_00265 [Segatella copri]
MASKVETRPGQGRKPIMDCSDEEAVRRQLRKTHGLKHGMAESQ